MAVKNASYPPAGSTQQYYNSNNEPPGLGPKKTLFVLVTVVGCIAILWPKIFYPMMFGPTDVPPKNTYVNKDIRPGGGKRSLTQSSKSYSWTFILSHFISTFDVTEIKSWRMLWNGIRSWKVCKCLSDSWSIWISKAFEFNDRWNKYVTSENIRVCWCRLEIYRLSLEPHI